MKRVRESGAQKLASRITEWFSTHPKDNYNYLQVSQELGIYGRANRQDVYDILLTLRQQDFLKEVSPGRFALASRKADQELEGVFERRRNGVHEVRVEGHDNPFVVYDDDDLHALSGDKVRIQAILGQKSREGQRARVVEVMERVKHRYVGEIQKNKEYCFVIPDNRALDKDIYIPMSEAGKLKTGDKVLVDIAHWPAFIKNPMGHIVDILGRSGDNTTEMHAILAEYGLPYKYPEKVVQAANRIADGCTPEEIARRLDYRRVTTFTIDPADAKDFDDALSLKRLAGGHWEAGVHIADVTHYVTPGSVIDKEAYSRATSIYLVDRTIPMLPERLCNELCSLRQDEDKLTFSVLFEMDGDANILRSRIVRTVIRSNRRFTYEEAQQIIETGQGDFAPEILQLDRLAKQLRARRFAQGAIAFDREEVKFVLDEKGKPSDVYFKVSRDANKLVEEFMLIANRAVAEAIGKVPAGKKPKTFVYRVHDKPSPERWDSLVSLASRLGHRMKSTGNNKEISQGINKLMQDIKGRPEENLLSMLAIRSMAKAVYTTQNIGHYGLAFDYYTHFTSPIRRYPDCMVHRLLDRYLFRNLRSAPGPEFEEKCEHSSAQEQLAAAAERASIKYKQAEYLNDRLGQVFQGTVSGVSEWGLYVELRDSLCEGMVNVRDLKDDHYIYDDRNFCLTGRRTRKKYTLGDTLNVQVAAVNMERKTVDFILADETPAPSSSAPSGRKRNGSGGRK